MIMNMDLQDKHKIKNDGYFLISPDINEKNVYVRAYE